MALSYLVRDGALGQSELAARLGITTGAATALVDRLERRGVAARQPHRTDRRRSIVTLTREGQELVAGSQASFAGAFSALTPDEIGAATRLLESLAEHLGRRSDELLLADASAELDLPLGQRDDSTR